MTGEEDFVAASVPPTGGTDPAAPSDETPPVLSFDAGPSGVTSAPTATVRFASDDPAAAFACSLDGAAYTPCASPLTLRSPQPLDAGPGPVRQL